jgi:hypothetical protein
VARPGDAAGHLSEGGAMRVLVTGRGDPVGEDAPCHPTSPYGAGGCPSTDPEPG